MATNTDPFSEIGSQYLLAPDFLQQLAALHLPDCPDKYQLLDQCVHCYRRQPANNTTTIPHQATTHEQEQEHRNTARLYAEVLSTPSPVYGLPTTVASFDTISQWTHNTNFYQTQMIPTNLPTSVPTWAEVASDPSQVVVPRYSVNLPSDSSIPESQSHMHGSLQYNVPRPQPSQSRPGPIRNPRLRQSNHGYTQAPADRPFRIRQTTTRGAALIIDDRILPPGPSSIGPSSHPRDVNSLVQSTNWGGHRQPAQQTVAQSPPTLMPPGPPSATSSKSKASSRRKGHQLRDPRYPHECQECHTRFAKNDDLRRHIDRTHSNIADRPHRCPAENCTWAFVNPKDLNRHFQTHSTTRARFACDYYACEKSYSRADNLQRHIDRDHLNVDSAYMSQSMSRQTSSTTNYSQPIFE